MRKNLLSLLSLLFAFGLQAQMTGSFQINVDFNEADYDYNRTVYFYVPETYDASQNYPLVLGFRGGPHSNAGQFRNQLQFLSDSIGAIVVCPENIEHFNVDEGLTKQLFNYTLDTVTSMYNIDMDRIYLTGLSFGGRHAVIVAMDEDAGDIPNIRGVIPFAAGRNSQLQPDYGAIDNFPPACMCIGLSDAQVFIDVSNTIHNAIIDNGGTSLLNEIPGVGHTVAFASFPQEMMECYRFIESSYPTSNDEVNDSSGSIRVYPNPSSTHFEFDIGQNINIKSIQLVDSSGRMVKDIPNDKRKVMTTGLSKGVYNLIVRTAKEKMVTSVIVE